MYFINHTELNLLGAAEANGMRAVGIEPDCTADVLQIMIGAARPTVLSKSWVSLATRVTEPRLSLLLCSS